MSQKPARLSWLSLFLFPALSLLLICCGSPGSPSSSSQGDATATSTSSSPAVTPQASPVGSSVASRPPLPFKAIRMLDGQSGWALTIGSVLKTGDGGLHWQDVTPVNAGLNSSAVGQFLNTQDAWIALGPANQQEGPGITVLRTTDAGASWQQSHIDDPLVSVIDVPHFLNQEQGWLEASSTPGAGSARSDIWASGDGGQTWRQLASNKRSDGLDLGYVTGISFRDTQTGIAAGNRGAGGDNTVPSLALTHDGGRTWQTQSLPHLLGGNVNPFNTSQPPVFFGNVVILPVLVSVQNGNLLVLYRSTDGGNSWRQTTQVPIQATNTYVLDASHAWATDTPSGKLYSTSDGGTHWSSTSDVAYHLGALSFPDPQHGWGVSSSSRLFQTADGGKTWQQISESIQ